MASFVIGMRGRLFIGVRLGSRQDVSAMVVAAVLKWVYSKCGLWRTWGRDIVGVGDEDEGLSES